MKSNRRNFIRTTGAGAAGYTFGATAIYSLSCTSQVSDGTLEDGQVLCFSL